MLFFFASSVFSHVFFILKPFVAVYRNNVVPIEIGLGDVGGGNYVDTPIQIGCWVIRFRVNFLLDRFHGGAYNRLNTVL